MRRRCSRKFSIAVKLIGVVETVCLSCSCLGLNPGTFCVSRIVSMLIAVTSKARVRRTGISPLHIAAEYNCDDVLELLIQAGFDVNAELSEERSKLYEDRRSTPLYFSVINSNIEAVEMLLAAGANPNVDMFRPLMVAARQCCIKTVTLLVEHGADVNACIPTHPTTFPAIYMFSMKYLPMFKYLLDHGGHALCCFKCVYGSGPHPPINITRSESSDDIPHDRQQRRGVQVRSPGPRLLWLGSYSRRNCFWILVLVILIV